MVIADSDLQTQQALGHSLFVQLPTPTSSYGIPGVLFHFAASLYATADNFDETLVGGISSACPWFYSLQRGHARHVRKFPTKPPPKQHSSDTS